MVRKIYSVLLFLCLSFSAFAQAQPKQVLSKADIDNFIKNFEAIQEVLDSNQAEFSSLQKEFDASEGAELTAALAKIRALAVSPRLSSGLSRLGLGNNGFEKVMLIFYGLVAVIIEQTFQESAIAGQPEIAAMIAEQVKPIKAAIHANDLSLISARAEELSPLLER
ncbi:MAG: hypothetical protein LBT68_05445 [Spirochaetales bacterium]|nr:hypothetical protein [Spirochaetales bacterium]